MPVKVSPVLPILIAGGGPAGLALAQNLRKRNIPFRIFERDNDGLARGQGWCVALQWTIPELRSSLPSDMPPLDTVSHLYNLGVKSQVLSYMSNGSELMGKEEGDDFLRADRLKLREYLGTHLNVEWGKAFNVFEEKEDRVRVTFKDGSTAEGCALVGADGAKSLVRAQLVSSSELEPALFDTILGEVKLNRQELLDRWKNTGRSVTVVQGKDAFVFIGLYRVSEDQQDSAWDWIVFRPKGNDEASGNLEDWSKERLKEHAVKWTKEFEPRFKDIVKKTPTETCKPMTSFVETWRPPLEGFSRGRVTLIGDAAHKVPPLGGVGINNAFLDGFAIGHLLVSESSIPEVFKKYDAEVTVRGRQAVAESTRWPVFALDDEGKLIHQSVRAPSKSDYIDIDI